MPAETPVPTARRIPALLVAALVLVVPVVSLAPAAAGTGGDVPGQPSLGGAIASDPASDATDDSSASAPASSAPGPGDASAPVPPPPSTVSPSPTVSLPPPSVPVGPDAGSTSAPATSPTVDDGSTVTPSSDGASQAPGGDGGAVPGPPGPRATRDAPTSATAATSPDATPVASPVLERQRTQARRGTPLTHTDVAGLALTAVGLIAAGAGLLRTGRRQRGRYVA